MVAGTQSVAGWEGTRQLRQLVAYLVFIALGLIWTVSWAVVVRRTGTPVLAYEVVAKGAAVIRRRLFAILGVILLGAMAASIYFFPYRAFAASRLGAPEVKVDVTAKMWQWTLSQTQIPAHKSVEFAVQAVDVNHGFSIYGPDDRLFAQVQAMPGYTNRLVLVFDQPGKYTVRCLEFCGLGHHAMLGSFDVT